MSKVIIGMTISLDGFVQDRDGGLAGLYTDMESLREAPVFQEDVQRVGAVVMGRRAFAMGDPDEYAESYELQVSIFVLTHEPPERHPRESDTLTFTFVTDGIESAIAQAKAAAGDKDVTVVGGQSTFQQCLDAGLADEIHIDIMPVLLREGLPLFAASDRAPVDLERIQVVALSSGRTHTKFRIIKSSPPQ